MPNLNLQIFRIDSGSMRLNTLQLKEKPTEAFMKILLMTTFLSLIIAVPVQAAHRNDHQEDRRDNRQDFREDHRGAKQDYRKGMHDARKDLRDGGDRQAFRKDKRDTKQDFREDMRDAKQDFREDRRDDRYGHKPVHKIPKHRYEHRNGHKLIIVAPRHRNYRHVTVIRPYGHVYWGYGHYHNDHDAYKWLAFTAITLKVLDNINEEAQREHEAAQIKAATAPIGETIYWEDGSTHGSVTATKQGTRAGGLTCREFQQEVTVGGETEQAYGTACLQADGAWEIVPE